VQLESGEAEFRAAAQLTPSLVEEWADLASRAVERNPFAEPAFAVPALRHLGPDRAGLLLVRRGGVAVAALPIAAERRWRRLPCVTAGWRHEHCYLGTPLLDRDDPVGAATVLLEAMVRRAGRPGAAVLEWVPTDGPACRALLDAARARGSSPLWWERFERAALIRAETPVASRTDHKHRRLRRKARALERDLGPVEVQDRAGDDAAVEAFLDLEASSWKGRESTALGSSPASAAFFRTMCATTQGAGQLELLALDAAGRAVALACNLVAGDGVFHFKSAFDERASRYSPGALLMLDVRDHFDAGPATLRDSCADPDAPLFEELWPDRVAVGTLVIPSGRAAWAVLAPLAASRRRLPGRERVDHVPRLMP
jgi:CelD/BcsL family acetyltransferase involved in cellulose biosynthesis